MTFHHPIQVIYKVEIPKEWSRILSTFQRRTCNLLFDDSHEFSLFKVTKPALRRRRCDADIRGPRNRHRSGRIPQMHNMAICVRSDRLYDLINSTCPILQHTFNTANNQHLSKGGIPLSKIPFGNIASLLPSLKHAHPNPQSTITISLSTAFDTGRLRIPRVNKRHLEHPRRYKSIPRITIGITIRIPTSLSSARFSPWTAQTLTRTDRRRLRGRSRIGPVFGRCDHVSLVFMVLSALGGGGGCTYKMPRFQHVEPPGGTGTFPLKAPSVFASRIWRSELI